MFPWICLYIFIRIAGCTAFAFQWKALTTSNNSVLLFWQRLSVGYIYLLDIEMVKVCPLVYAVFDFLPFRVRKMIVQGLAYSILRCGIVTSAHCSALWRCKVDVIFMSILKNAFNGWNIPQSVTILTSYRYFGYGLRSFQTLFRNGFTALTLEWRLQKTHVVMSFVQACFLIFVTPVLELVTVNAWDLATYHRRSLSHSLIARFLF